MKFSLIVSLKWTHKDDKWISFWRTNQAGYCWYQSWCGLYDPSDTKSITRNGTSDEALAIHADTLKDHWIKVEYEGQERKVIPNNEETLKILGITKDQFIKNTHRCERAKPWK